MTRRGTEYDPGRATTGATPGDMTGRDARLRNEEC
jgi:hypothetical protein